ncbi:hypothetical protein PHACT_08375 [Pseudohongiella acticola]|uniref:Beta-lactamase-related domain-containing protein n=1 Tax=Pseudohongiella acticola TaxID=1524254 RepID=A0A1E8CL73_9GAMM|nr:serine hydrolase domain-containing protein [Pseudohongiella acticola]OFE13153.1 hypothetical protein PHACT_08375 [Pseudohongiella acticola]
MFYLKLTIGSILAVACWMGMVFFSAFYGWWMQPIASPGNSEQFFEYASNRLEVENPGNSAFVLIENGHITGEYYSSGSDQINRDTAFSTASMSKWFTAFGVMKLVENGELDLDKPISEYLSRWELPPGQFDNNQVTVRGLLSHTAGFNDGLGFGDYEADEELPTLEESLTNPRASSDRDISIAVSYAPGSEWRYSGGGYLLLELVVEEVTGQSFEDYMRESVFGPLEMNRSGYGYIGNYENNAGSYGRNGEKAPAYQYASKAATAFVTSISDLSKFVMSQVSSSQNSNTLSVDTIEKMREPHGRTSGFDIWGLGTILYSPTESGDFVFGHDGANDPAINTTARINPDTSDAIVILETGHPSLATNIASEWVLWQTGYPDVLDNDAVIASMYLPALIGTFAIFLLFSYLGFRHYSKRRAA